MSLDVFLTVDEQVVHDGGVPIRENGRLLMISHDEWDERHYLPYEEVIGYQSYADILEELKGG